jgi:ribA/ribD-fused uncharacterized protein
LCSAAKRREAIVPDTELQHLRYFQKSNSTLTHDEVRYRSLAHYFFYQKALYLGDIRTAERILKAKEAEKIKWLALKIESAGNDKAWRNVCSNVLEEGLKVKFLQDLTLCEWLSKQSDEDLHLISSIWGLSENDLIDNAESVLENTALLGQALIKVRLQLIAT